MTTIGWIAEIDYTRPNGTAETLYLARGPVGRFAHTDPDRPLVKYRNRLVEVPGYATRALSDVSRLAGDVGAGVLTASNADGALSYLRGCVPGEVRVRRGAIGTPWAAWKPVLTGRADAFRWDLGGQGTGRLSVPVYDLRADLDRDIQTNAFAGDIVGAAGYGGGIDQKGQPLPLALGDLTDAHVPAPWANAEARVARLHDGAAGALAALAGVYDRGGPAGLTMMLDDTGAAFDGAAPGPTQYALDRPRGLLRLGGTLGGQVTYGLTGTGGTSVPSLLAWMLTRRGHAARIGASVAALPADAPVGLWIMGGSYRDPFERLAASAGAWCLPDAFGRWQAGLLALPAGAPVLSIPPTRIYEVSLWDAALANPVWSVTIKFGRLYRTFGRNDLASALWNTQAEADLREEWRTAKVEDAALKERPGARAVTIETALRGRAAAEALAERVFALLSLRPDGTPPLPLKIATEMTDALLDLRIGDEVHVAYPQEGIDGVFVVLGIRPAAPRDTMIELELLA